MKIKIVGFKVGESRPTANRTYELIDKDDWEIQLASQEELGVQVAEVLAKSDFISIRRVDD